MISGIYETRLTGSELQWGNSAAHKFELQALVAPSGEKILAICFLGSEYFAKRFNRPFDKKTKKNYRVFCTLKRTFLAQKKGL